MKSQRGVKDRVSVTGLMASVLVFTLCSAAIWQIAPTSVLIRQHNHAVPTAVEPDVSQPAASKPVSPLPQTGVPAPDASALPKVIVKKIIPPPAPVESAPRRVVAVRRERVKPAPRTTPRRKPAAKVEPVRRVATKPATIPTTILKPAKSITGATETRVERVAPSQVSAGVAWYSVRVGHSDSKYRTDMLREVLVQKGYPEARTEKEGNLYHVRVGDFQFSHQADEANGKLKEMGLMPKVVEKTVAK